MNHPVSIHGGHSGQFCCHATDTLEAVVRTYIAQGYPWVGITEHMPPASEDFLYPEELQAGWDVAALGQRFARYMALCRELQRRYADRIRIYVGFETETYPGSIALVRRLIAHYAPDYVVGSVHHVHGLPFDYSPERYAEAAHRCGGLDALYVHYFDQQYAMIRRLRPAVVGHLDLIRIFDPDYPSRLVSPAVWKRIVRNLELIKAWQLILDFNLRPLSRGAQEPYLAAPILRQACAMGIDIVPGDDSHGVADIGRHMHRAMDLLRAAGFNGRWSKPVRQRP